MIVVDSSVAAAWALMDESDEWTRSARNAALSEGILVPWLFWFEIRNVLAMNERRGRIDATDSNYFLNELPKLIAEVDEQPDSSAVMTLARAHGLTVYDAAYLELSARRKLPLCTRDQALIAAAAKSGVTLWQ